MPTTFLSGSLAQRKHINGNEKQKEKTNQYKLFDDVLAIE
jgi:hypothetical protein